MDKLGVPTQVVVSSLGSKRKRHYQLLDRSVEHHLYKRQGTGKRSRNNRNLRGEWWGIGTGFLDEDARTSHTWLGTTGLR